MRKLSFCNLKISQIRMINTTRFFTLLSKALSITPALFRLLSSWSRSDKDVKTKRNNTVMWNSSSSRFKIRIVPRFLILSVSTCYVHHTDVGIVRIILCSRDTVSQTFFTWLYIESTSEGFNRNSYKPCEDLMTYLDLQSSHQNKLDILMWNLDGWFLPYIHHIWSWNRSGHYGNIYP